MITLLDLSNLVFVFYNYYDVKLITKVDRTTNRRRMVNLLIYPFYIAWIVEKLVLINLGFVGICKLVEIRIQKAKWLIHCG